MTDQEFIDILIRHYGFTLEEAQDWVKQNGQTHPEMIKG